jgi:hypothetical protein
MNMSGRLFLACLVVGCTNKTSDTAGASGAVKDSLFPFPSMHQMRDGHIALPDDLPMAIDGTPVDTERLAWRTGFSVVQSSVVALEQLIDEDSLPQQAAPTAEGSVQMWDLTTGTPILCFAEVDHAEPVDDEFPTLIVRPQNVLTAGHQIAVVLTDAVRTADGTPLPTVSWYRDVIAGNPSAALEEWESHYQALHDDLGDLGIDNIVLAFDFPVADGGQPVRHVAGQVNVPSSYTIDKVRSTDDGILMADGGWRQLQGSYEVDNWLIDDLYFELDGDGMPIQQGTATAELFIYMPESTRNMDAGSVPVWIFGHGLFGSPDEYLGTQDDRSKVAKLADEAGAIVFATVWRGFKSTDRIHAIHVAEDFARIHEITERLTQGVANVIALSRLIQETEILNHPELLGLPDSGDIRYYGISLGGIAGAVTVANNERISHAVLHVGGGAWSTMLERSSQWIPFDWLMIDYVPSPRDRQLLYALSQLYWDPVDPMNHIAALKGRNIVWQEAIGDEQVANMTTRMLVRAVEATQLEPIVEAVEGVPVMTGPIRLPAYVQLDPELPIPNLENRPAAPSGAHSNPRTWPGVRRQIVEFLDWDAPGVLNHHCGDLPCSESNPG